MAQTLDCPRCTTRISADVIEKTFAKDEKGALKLITSTPFAPGVESLIQCRCGQILDGRHIDRNA